MRVLHVGESVRGGVATYLRSIVPAQVERYGEEEVFGLIPERFHDDVSGIFPTLLAASWSGRKPLSLLKYFLCVHKAIRAVRPDIVNAHGTFAALFVRLAMLFWLGKRPKVVYVSHGWAFTQEVSKHERLAYALIERLLLPLTDGVVHISHDQMQAAHANGVKPRLETMIYNGMPELRGEIVPKPADGTLKVLFVGRLDRQKGIGVLLEALQHVQRQDIAVKIAGDAVRGDEPLQVPEQVKGRVQMLGWCNQTRLRELYGEADVFVMPSRWEGFGLVALEAMRQKTAVFASNRGALPEIVVPGVTGRIFDVTQPLELAKLID